MAQVRLTSEQRRRIYDLKHKLKTGKMQWPSYHHKLTAIYNEATE
jgi:hypothetical protein